MAGKVVRSRRNRILLGVLGGLAEHLGLDPTLVRLAFIILLALNPVTMTLLYFIAALIIPAEGEEEGTLAERADSLIRETGDRLSELLSGGENSRALGIVLVVLGALLLAGSFVPFIVPAINFRTLTAVALLTVGFLLLTGNGTQNRPGGVNEEV